MSPDDRAERFGRVPQNDDDIAPPLTVEQFLHQRTGSELIFGRVRPSLPPPVGNDRMVTQLMAALLRYQRVDPDTHAWALPVVVLDHAGGLVLNPALAVVTADRWERVRDRIWGAPNVIVEVIDKRRARRTRHVRVRWYRDFGVQECWLLDSRVQRVEVLDLQQRRLPYIYSLEAEFSSRILRGFRMPVADIFPGHDAVRPE
jgi:Uma2 family endonuclease